MKLRRLSIESMPGIDSAYEIHFEDGVTVVEGPNSSGKSSVCRALRALLWREFHTGAYIRAAATFEDAQGELRVERDGPRVTWTRAGETIPTPVLPGSNQADSFFLGLEELVDLEARQGAQVSQAIRRQMAGGYDLDKVTAELCNPERRGYARGKDNAHSEATRAVNKEQLVQDALARREAQLGELRETATQLQATHNRKQHLETCLKLVDLHAQLHEQEEHLGQLPDALLKLNGNELELLDDRLEDLDDKAGMIKEQSQRIADAEQTAADTKLAEPIDEQVLDTLDALAAELDTAAGELVAAEKSLAGVNEELEQAREQAGVQVGIELEDQPELFEFLRGVGQLERDCESLGRTLQALGRRSEKPEEELSSVREGLRILARWLSTPVDSGSATRPAAGQPQLLRWLFPLAAGAMLLAAFLGFQGSAGWQLALGLGLGLLIGALLLRSKTASTTSIEGSFNRRADLELEYPRSLSAPDNWEEGAVRKRRLELEQTSGRWTALDELEREEERLTAELKELEDKRQEASQRLRKLSATLGLREDLPTVELFLLAQRLDQLAQSQLDQRKAVGEMESCASRKSAGLAKVNVGLTEVNEPGLEEQTGVIPALRGLRNRSAALATARTQAEDAQRDLARLEEQKAVLEKKLDELYAEADLEPGDRGGLAALVARVDDYKTAAKEHELLGQEVSLMRKSLPDEFAEQLLALSAADLESQREQAKAAFAGLDECREEISTIEVGVLHAREHSTLQDALARRHRALDELSASFDNALDGLAGRMLLDGVQERHERDQAPPVLQRARQLFARFTDHAYELRVPATDTGSFIAFDVNTGQERTPAELSTGTRAQLLIAARLAFTDVVDDGQQLPIVLDEALDHSDPGRFASIVASLGELARPKAEGTTGRQMIYLTCDPQDALRIRNALKDAGHAVPRYIDLGDLRNLAKTTLDAGELVPLKRNPPPAPGKMSAAKYGETIDVTPLDPTRGPRAQHLFHVLADELTVLHKLLSANIETIGECRAAFGNDPAYAALIEGHLSEEPTLAQRCELFGEFCGAYGSGRGKPVTRETLLGVEGLSDRWHADLALMVEELGGDGRALLVCLRTKSDDRSKGMRGQTVDDLELALLESGHVSDQPILGPAEVRQRVLASQSAANLPAPRVAELAQRWWDQAQMLLVDSAR